MGSAGGFWRGVDVAGFFCGRWEMRCLKGFHGGAFAIAEFGAGHGSALSECLVVSWGEMKTHPSRARSGLVVRDM